MEEISSVDFWETTRADIAVELLRLEILGINKLDSRTSRSRATARLHLFPCVLLLSLRPHGWGTERHGTVEVSVG